MDSKVNTIRPQQIPVVPMSRKRQGGKDGSQQKTFELGGERATPAPGADQENTTPSPNRSVTPREPGEVGAQLDITG